MTNTDLLQAMGHIDPKLIADAAPDVPWEKTANKPWIKWAALAACFVLIVGAIIGVPMLFTDDNTSDLPTDIDNIIWDTNIGDTPSSSGDVPLWEGWRVDCSLYQKLEEAEAGQYFALHISNRDVENVGEIFSGMGICTVEKNNKLFIFIRKEELAKLRIPDKKNYRISLAKRRNYEHEEGDIPTLENNVTGFALEKIECQTFDHSSRYSDSDEELIEKINALMKAGQFDTDRIYFYITSSVALSEDLFSDIEYEDIILTPKYKTCALNWVYVKYENINLEALKNLSNMSIILSIHISVDMAELAQAD